MNEDTDIGLSDLRTVLRVAETGSFRSAAARMSIGQPSVSRRIRRLEDVLGVSLFERHSGGVRLTVAGEHLVTRATAFMAGLKEALETTRSAGIAEAGKLRVGIIASLSRGALRNVVANFLEEHVDVDFRLIESDRSELLTLLSHRELDAVVAAGEAQPGSGDSALLAKERIFLAVSSTHDWASMERLEWQHVRKANFVVSAREPGPEIHDYILRRISDLGRSVSVSRHRLGREGIMTLVGLGFGVSLVADHWRGVSYPNVTFVPIGADNETVPFSITWRPENDNPALRRFISLARIEAKRNGALS